MAQRRPFQILKTDLDKLRKAAQANADQFGIPYIVFSDTSGKWRVERFSGYHSGPMELFAPKVKRNPRGRSRFTPNDYCFFVLHNNRVSWECTDGKTRATGSDPVGSSTAEVVLHRAIKTRALGPGQYEVRDERTKRNPSITLRGTRGPADDDLRRRRVRGNPVNWPALIPGEGLRIVLRGGKFAVARILADHGIPFAFDRESGGNTIGRVGQNSIAKLERLLAQHPELEGRYARHVKKNPRKRRRNPSITLRGTRGPADDDLRRRYKRMSRPTKKLFRRGAAGPENVGFSVQVRRGLAWITLARFASKDAARQYGRMIAASYPSKTFRVFWK